MAKKTRGVTIPDIAKAAGVSTATVSRVLNGVDYPVRPELKERVLEVAKDLNYTPNIFGRMLKGGKSNDIGIIIPTLTNPFYAQVVSGIERECRKRGYNPIFCSSYSDPEKEREFIHLLMQKRVEGMLISTINQDSTFLKNVLKQQSNIVLFDQQTEDLPCDNISFDFFEGGKLAANYLIENGHRDIAFLTLSFVRKSRQSIYDGIKAAMKSHGLSLTKERTFILSIKNEYEDSIDEFENGRMLARQFIEANCPASAIIAINDITAFGIIREMSDHGVDIPGDISIIGFDNISTSAMINPPLTTINQPSFETGRLAARVLIEKIEQEIDMNSNLLLKPSVVERKSVKRI
ncbi:LacI family DNA-binding transcriptional regulator [Youxingia wuxianensis]|uniref:LacI family DNA-binding transcriptional regulator n=1 Tax=Youxingia wuxianensis TaxID=2763678 RepID=A0A926ERR3_9FIRM|nr:LacI family DNA-binding transcriptional regulator [Youxingia wuxianensis]MBC8585412.1 LacI family DNA-binding transcriptional regulator [Youxingia wuxianensis]